MMLKRYLRSATFAILTCGMVITSAAVANAAPQATFDEPNPKKLKEKRKVPPGLDSGGRYQEESLGGGGVPEINPSLAASAVALLVGGALILGSRRKAARAQS